MEMINKLRQSALFLISVLLMACAANPAQVRVESKSSDELDAAIRETSDYLNKQLPKGNKLVILNIQSEYPALSEYIIDKLIANTVNDQVFTVVDRQQLDTLREELDFQMTGEVDDDTAQALGRIVEAQIIVSGAVSRIGDLYQLQVQALNVQTAQIAGQFSRIIPEGPTLATLVRSQATVSADVPSQSPRLPDVLMMSLMSRQAMGYDTSDKRPVVVSSTAESIKEYKIGDTGPAGGIVFYDKFSTADGWRYMEVAPAETEQQFPWGLYDITVGGTQPGTGGGKKNTQLIVTKLRERDEFGAARFCDDLEYGGYADWFLPSRDELDLMYQNLKEKEIGEFGSSLYWSSLEHGDNDYSFYQSFSDGKQSYDSKSNSHLARAVRRF